MSAYFDKAPSAVKLCPMCGENIYKTRSAITAVYCMPCSAKRNRASTVKYVKSSDKHRRHQAARAITKTAVRVGFLPDPRGMKCQDCGRQAECYDHRDYNLPLEVDPVCMRCNSSRGAGIPLRGELCVSN